MNDQADSASTTTTESPASMSSGPLRTHVASRWMKKMAIFLIVCVGLGTWGLLDAAVIYPNRGEKYSQHTLAEYLSAADNLGVLPIARRVNVEDPVTELAELQERAGAGQLNPFDQARLTWLKSLEPVHGKPLTKLTRQNTEMASRAESDRTDTVTVFLRPAEKFEELKPLLTTGSKPKPLSQTDILVQWLICAAGYAGGLIVLVRIIQTRSTVYRYEPDAHKLILPGGKSITPGEIETVDKSKWHKFFVSLDLKDGSSHQFDLLRFEPLEDWILEMEESDPRLRAAREEAEAEEQTSTVEVASDSGGDGGDGGGD